MIFVDAVIVLVFLISRWCVVIELTGICFCDVVRRDHCHHWMDVTQERKLFNSYVANHKIMSNYQFMLIVFCIF